MTAAGDAGQRRRRVRPSRTRGIVLALMAVALLIAAFVRRSRPGDHARAPCPNGASPNSGCDDDPFALKRGSIEGNRDGTPGTRVR